MKAQKRFIKSVIDTAAQDTTVMPWTRGATRRAFIAKRDTVPLKRKTA